jgi:hypothetical protein
MNIHAKRLAHSCYLAANATIAKYSSVSKGRSGVLSCNIGRRTYIRRLTASSVSSSDSGSTHLPSFWLSWCSGTVMHTLNTSEMGWCTSYGDAGSRGKWQRPTRQFVAFERQCRLLLVDGSLTDVQYTVGGTECYVCFFENWQSKELIATGTEKLYISKLRCLLLGWKKFPCQKNCNSFPCLIGYLLGDLSIVHRSLVCDNTYSRAYL